VAPARQMRASNRNSSPLHPMELIDEVKKNGKTLGVEYFPP
jgi:hypothetical protein